MVTSKEEAHTFTPFLAAAEESKYWCRGGGLEVVPVSKLLEERKGMRRRQMEESMALKVAGKIGSLLNKIC